MLPDWAEPDQMMMAITTTTRMRMSTATTAPPPFVGVRAGVLDGDRADGV